ncbi:MAG TPA: DUF5131 family protein [Xanthobacteraceae bacterium]|nr:DUF5131 family protein [Xanthobacteraceae bacterium]
MEDSHISWTDHTHNIWIGCEHAPASDDPADRRTSPGCDNCYAEAIDGRFGGGHWGPGTPRRFLSDAYWRKPISWNARARKNGVRERVFCSSLADWAEIRDGEVGAAMDRERARLWKLIPATPWLDWLLLSKRPQNWRDRLLLPWHHDPWPNVWLGVTGENTEQLLRRVSILRRTPAAKRFISAEPLLEHIPAEVWDDALGIGRTFGADYPEINWLIIGDESGPHRRPAQVDWYRTAREAALRHGVALHVKQWNGPTSPGMHGDGATGKGKIHLPILDGKRWDQIPR